MFGYRYVDNEGAANLKKYKYAGEDRSYYYVYVLTPMNKVLVNFIPIWMAPNVVTTIGGLFSISALLLTVYFSPDMTSALPTWLSLYVAFAIFAYQTIDNLDGRQARRTGSSSPLGLLFDHGWDAMNVSVLSLTISAVLQFGASWKLIAFWTVFFTGFAFATWEEYYTGELILPEINAPSDGILVMMIFSFISAYQPGFWAQPLAQTFPSIFAHTRFANESNNLIPISMCLFSLVVTLFVNIRNVCKNRKLNLNENMFNRLLPFLYLLIIFYTWIIISPTNIFSSHPRLFILSFGFMFGNLICKLMLAHLCAQKYRSYRLVQIPMFLALANVALPMMALGEPIISEPLTLYAFFCWSFTCWLHFVVSIITEITHILGIKAFVITPKQH